MPVNAAGGSPPKDVLLDLAIAGGLVVGVGSFFAVGPLVDVIVDAVEFLPYPF